MALQREYSHPFQTNLAVFISLKLRIRGGALEVEGAKILVRPYVR